MRALLNKIGWCLVVIGALIFGLTIYSKTLGANGKYGGVLLGAGCMILWRKHRPVFGWK